MLAKPLFFVALVSLLFANCATIVSKSSYPFGVDTEPDRAHVTITDRKGKQVYSGTTPATVKLKSGSGYFKRAIYTIVIEKEGYQKQTVTVKASLNGWYFGNLVFGGLLGLLIVDPISGAMYRLKGKDVRETLAPLSTAGSAADLKIMDIRNIPANWKGKLVRVN